MGFWLKCASVGADSLAHFERLPIPDICHERHEYIRVNFFGRCKFLQIERKKLAFSTDLREKLVFLGPRGPLVLPLIGPARPR